MLQSVKVAVQWGSGSPVQFWLLNPQESVKKMTDIKIVYLPIDTISPYEKNPRNNDASVEEVANSIREFGFKQPIVVDKDYTIVAGHTRFRAAKKLGITNVPCVVATDLSEEQVKAYRLADNKVSEKSLWDQPLLDLELLDINMDMSQFGFDILETEETEKKAEKERNLESMELKAFEHYDYVVFVFKNEMDWLNIVNRFKLKKVNAGYGKTKKIGVGRVIDGKRLLEELRD